MSAVRAGRRVPPSLARRSGKGKRVRSKAGRLSLASVKAAREDAPTGRGPWRRFRGPVLPHARRSRSAAGGRSRMLKDKREGTQLGFKAFNGADGRRYLVFCTLDGSFHAFVEVEAKEASRQCGAIDDGSNTRQLWESIWDQ